MRAQFAKTVYQTSLVGGNFSLSHPPTFQLSNSRVYLVKPNEKGLLALTPFYILECILQVMSRLHGLGKKEQERAGGNEEK